MKTCTSRLFAMIALGGFTLGVVACAVDPTAPEEGAAVLLTMEPPAGSTDVSVGSSVTITFDHAIAAGMEEYAALHEGTLTGPEVDGTWVRSENGMTLTFTPAAPLKAATTYVIHIGGGMMDDQGNHVNLEQHGLGMGGQWATQSMMSGGMGSGMGMGQNGQMMGDSWAHPSNGSFGMVFSFTTAG